MWPSPQLHLVIFTEEILNGKFDFLDSDQEVTTKTFSLLKFIFRKLLKLKVFHFYIACFTEI